MIKFGLFLSSDFPANDDMADRLIEIRTQVSEARRVGFASLWAGQHFLSAPWQRPQPTVMLANLLREAEGMTVGSNILVLPLLNPTLVAEESATMDLLSGGRYVLGIGLGYRDEEFQAFGVDRSERVGRMVESLAVIRRLFSEETVDHHGKYFTVPNVGLGLRPTHPGGPPIWIAASTDKAIARAAQLGDAWPITFYPSIAYLQTQLVTYRDALAAAGKPEPPEMPILREVFVVERPGDLELCREALMTKYRTYAAWGQDSFLPESERFDQPFEQFRTDRFLIGSAQEILDDLVRYRDTLGVNHFIFRVQWPGLPTDYALRTVRLLGERVLPFLGA